MTGNEAEKLAHNQIEEAREKAYVDAVRVALLDVYMAEQEAEAKRNVLDKLKAMTVDEFIATPECEDRMELFEWSPINVIGARK